MKRILITGKNSYIGTSFENWLLKEPDKYTVDTIDMKDGTWREKDFSTYDVVFHVAGIAHIKETKHNRSLYYKVNRDLAIETAKKAKQSKVKQFIFLSSMSVYGLDEGVIDENTPTLPKNSYGKSKLEAEIEIQKMQCEKFKVVTLRPPMVYGKGCKGNYQLLSKLTKITPVFPDFENQRSMIYIDNLSEFVKRVIDMDSEGLFLPQNKDYVCTSAMVRIIAETNGRSILFTKMFNNLLIVLRLNTVNKVFGSLYYMRSMSNQEMNYEIFNFENSIIATEMRD